VSSILCLANKTLYYLLSLQAYLPTTYTFRAPTQSLTFYLGWDNLLFNFFILLLSKEGKPLPFLFIGFTTLFNSLPFLLMITYFNNMSKYHFLIFHHSCCNLSFGLATKAKGLQECEPRRSPGVTSHTLGSVGKCEGVNLHTPKATPTLGDGVLVDSGNFRKQFQGSKLNVLWRSLYHWKDLET